MNSNIENRTDKTFISTPSKFRNLYMYSQKTRNFQLPYFLTFYIDAYSVSKAKVVKMLYELHPTYNNISNILHSISI